MMGPRMMERKLTPQAFMAATSLSPLMRPKTNNEATISASGTVKPNTSGKDAAKYWSTNVAGTPRMMNWMTWKRKPTESTKVNTSAVSPAATKKEERI